MPASIAEARSTSTTSIPKPSSAKAPIACARWTTILVQEASASAARQQDRCHPLCARARRSVSRHLPWHAARRHRIRAPQDRARTPAARIRSGDAASGGRVDHRVAEPRWPIERRDLASNLGSTMRLGAQPCDVVPGSLAHRIYGSATVSERHRHRYEVNNHYLPRSASASSAPDAQRNGRRSLRDDRASRPSVVLRLPVPSGIHVQSATWPSAVPGLRQRALDARRRVRPESLASGMPNSPHLMCPHAHSFAAPEGAAYQGGPARDLTHAICGFEAGLTGLFFSSRAHARRVAATSARCRRSASTPARRSASRSSSNRRMTRRTHVGQMFRGPGIDEGLRILSEVKRQSDAV